MKEELFETIEKILKNTEIDHFEIYDLCEENEKLKLQDDYKSNDIFAYKVFNNNILLKYYTRKTGDIVEIRYLDEESLKAIQTKFKDVSYKKDDLYIRISIDNYKKISEIEEEIRKIYKSMFISYMNSEESFGCCSKYLECSDKKRCVNDNIRLRFSCQYKKNLDNGKIFYGINQNC